MPYFMRPRLLVLAALFALASHAALAREYPIGKPQIRDGLEVATVYLQPMTMEPAGMMRGASASDIHLEADIKAHGDKNGNGFAEGTCVPYLAVRLRDPKQGGNDGDRAAR